MGGAGGTEAGPSGLGRACSRGNSSRQWVRGRRSEQHRHQYPCGYAESGGAFPSHGQWQVAAGRGSSRAGWPAPDKGVMEIAKPASRISPTAAAARAASGQEATTRRAQQA